MKKNKIKKKVNKKYFIQQVTQLYLHQNPLLPLSLLSLSFLYSFSFLSQFFFSFSSFLSLLSLLPQIHVLSPQIHVLPPQILHLLLLSPPSSFSSLFLLTSSFLFLSPFSPFCFSFVFSFQEK